MKILLFLPKTLYKKNTKSEPTIANADIERSYLSVNQKYMAKNRLYKIPNPEANPSTPSMSFRWL